jgi:GTP-binding protein
VKERRFVDSAVVYAQGGRGGNGCCSFRREKFVPKGGPDGGDGGRGGHVALRVDPNADSLVSLYYAPHQRAEDGGHGKGKKQHGRNGRDLVVLVPCGTEVWDTGSGRILADLVKPGDEFVVAQGGKGGLGNPHWLTNTHQVPYEHSAGEPGEERTVRCELKVAADAGLIGLPNSGKSSLLTGISHAHPRIAPYPFTTLYPVIGTVQTEDYTRFSVADIPGLVAGAHEGVGLGDRLLRHVERATALVYVVDMAGSEGRDPVDDYRVLKRELGLYDKELTRRPMLIAANKMDLPGAAENLKAFRRSVRKEVVPVSALTGEGIAAFRRHLQDLVRGRA